jgi:hypothetical protein
MIRFLPACAAALLIAGLPVAAHALDPDKSLTAYKVANRCFAITDAIGRTELPSQATKRVDQMLFWGVAAQEFGQVAKISQDVQKQDLEAATSHAGAQVASNDPSAEKDLQQCEAAFRTAMGGDTSKPPVRRR